MIAPGGCAVAATCPTVKRGVVGFGALLLLVAGQPSALGIAPRLCQGESVTITGSFADERITGTDARDVIAARGGDDVVFALSGDDKICAGGGSDRVLGGPGNDSLDGGRGSDRASFTTSTASVHVDFAESRASGDGDDSLHSIEGAIGSAYDDSFVGSEARETVTGKGGNDLFSGSGGDDSLRGGRGEHDRLTFLESPGPVIVNMRDGLTTCAFGSSDEVCAIGEDEIAGIEDAEGARAMGAHQGEGNIFFGGPGDNRFIGGSVTDRFTDIGGGDDFFDGGPGDDQANYLLSPNGVELDLGAGTVRGFGSDRLVSVELVHASPHDDVIIGTSGDDMLLGDEGGDRIRGGAGDDSLIPDAYFGPRGDDDLDGGAGKDTVFLENVDTPVTIDGARGEVTSGSSVDRVSDLEIYNATSFDDVFIGGDADEELIAHGGADRADGGGGNDWIAGYGGDDVMEGGPGTDTVSFFGTVDPVHADLRAGIATGEGNDSISGFENIWGSRAGDVLIGDDNPNVMMGLYGDDRMEGGGGSDAVMFSCCGQGVTVDIASGTASGHGSDNFIDFESVIGSVHADFIYGDDGVNILYGLEGDDTIDARAGDDYLHGGFFGMDALDGGQGSDTCDHGEIYRDCEHQDEMRAAGVYPALNVHRAP